MNWVRQLYGKRRFTYVGISSSGFTYVWSSPSRHCQSEVTRTAHRDATDGATTFSRHRVFVAQWHESETKALPFSFPSLPPGSYLPPWTPGTEAKIHGDHGTPSSDDGGLYMGIFVLIIVCSVVGLIVLIWLLWCARGYIEGTGREEARVQT